MNNRVSGIQRVILNVAGHLLHTLNGEFEICAVFYHQREQAFYEVDAAFLQPNKHYSSEAIMQALGDMAPRAVNLEKYQTRPFKRLFHETRQLFRTATYNAFCAKQVGSALQHRVSFREGDIYLFMGAGWDVPWLMPELERLQAKQGVRLVFFIHDLIPVFAAQSKGSMHKQTFLNWIETIRPFVRHYLTCSHYTKHDLQTYLLQCGITEDALPNIDVTPLAHEFISDDQVATRDDLSILEGQDFVLFVGPVMGRKNAIKIIDTWVALAKDSAVDQLPKLVLAGNQKGSEKYFSSLKKSQPDILPHLFCLHSPNDAELEWLYKHCLFSCFPSSYEGWGLPVGESLWFGKYCITSTSSSLPEVGGDYVDLVDLEQEDALYQALKRVILDRAYLDKRNQAIDHNALRSWKQTAGDILQKLTHKQPGQLL